MLAIEREDSKTPSTRQYEWVTLIYFIYFILPCRDRCMIENDMGGSNKKGFEGIKYIQKVYFR
jgi:hypothetical protein